MLKRKINDNAEMLKHHLSEISSFSFENFLKSEGKIVEAEAKAIETIYEILRMPSTAPKMGDLRKMVDD